MPVPVEKILAAATRLADLKLAFDIRGGIAVVSPIVVEALMVLVQAAPQIVDAFEEIQLAPRVEEGVTLPPGFELDSALFIKGGVLEEASVRIRDACKLDNITTLRDLRQYNGRLRRLPNFGKVSLKWVTEELEHKGFVVDDFPCLKPKE